MKFISNYTNGVGHLVMSVITTVAAIVMMMISSSNQTVLGVAISLILTVNGYWFMPSAAKQVATEVVSQIKEPVV